MQTKPQLCVIIPLYNGARYIEATLASVLGQGYDNFGVVVVDDGSVDKSGELVAAVAASDSRVQLVRQDNAGIAGARNAGLDHAPNDAEFILYLDHDDILLKDALARLAAVLAADSTAPAAHGDSVVIDQMGAEIATSGKRGEPMPVVRRRLCSGGLLSAFKRAVACDPSEPTTFATLLYSNCVRTTGQVLFRRNVLEELGGFDPMMAPVDDLDMYTRASLKGPIVHLAEPVASWRYHSANTSRNEAVMHQALQRYLSKTIMAKLTARQRADLRTLALYRVLTSIRGLLARNGVTTWRDHLRPNVALLVRAYLRSYPGSSPNAPHYS